MTWFLRFFGSTIDSAIQRAVKNPRTSFGGGSIALGLEAVIQYMQVHGCDLSLIAWTPLIPLLQGLHATDANKTLQPSGPPNAADLQNVRDGGTAF